MTSLFKITPSVPAGKEKIGDTDFKQYYPGVNMNMMWREIEPYVRQATKIYVLPFIGKALYDDLATNIQANTLTPEQSELAEALKDAIAYYAVAVTLPKKKTVIASMGAVENEADSGTTQSSLWGFKATLWSVTQDADRHMDYALQLLEQYVKTPVVYFDLWKNSPAYEAGSGDFFRTTADFQYRHPINSSRRTFQAMLPIMREMADLKIKPILCDATFNELKTQLRANTLTADNAILLGYVQKALAKWTVTAASDALAVLPDQDGFRVVSSVDGIDTRTYSTETTRGAIVGIKDQAEQSARTATADLIAYLYANADKFPAWRDSACNRANSALEDRVFCEERGAVFLG